MSLENFERAGWIQRRKPAPADVENARAIMRRDLAAARRVDTDPDWRFNIAYNAVLKVAEAALAASGFEPARSGNKHERAIETLRFTMGLDAGTVQQIQAYRKKRNIAEYEAAGLVSRGEADEILALAEELVARFDEWLAETHPGLRR